MHESAPRPGQDNFTTRIDAWLRREDTWLAAGLRRLSPLEGKEYRQSTQKRVFELAIALPAAAAASVPTGMLLIANTIEEPFGHPFYTQERIKTAGETTNITKFRTMTLGSEPGPDTSLVFTGNYSPETDPRNTKLGKIIRAFEFDELPQLFEVLLGKLSLVDIRAPTALDLEIVAQHREKTHMEWQTKLLEGRLGLFSLNSAVNMENRKHILKRQHYDLLYARKASLGLDLYILYKTAGRMVKKAAQKMHVLGGKPIM